MSLDEYGSGTNEKLNKSSKIIDIVSCALKVDVTYVCLDIVSVHMFI